MSAAEGGICLYLGRNHWYAAALSVPTDRNGPVRLLLRKHVEDMESMATEISLPAGTHELRLGIHGQDESVSFLWAMPGEAQWQPLGSGSTKLLWPELASTWTGTVTGVWASISESNLFSSLVARNPAQPQIEFPPEAQGSDVSLDTSSGNHRVPTLPDGSTPAALFRCWRYRETKANWWKMDGSIPKRLTEGDDE